jgi:hypothetical protein
MSWGVLCLRIVEMELGQPKKEDSCGLIGALNELRFDPVALAVLMLALAGQLRHAFRVGTGGAAVLGSVSR